MGELVIYKEKTMESNETVEEGPLVTRKGGKPAGVSGGFAFVLLNTLERGAQNRWREPV